MFLGIHHSTTNFINQPSSQPAGWFFLTEKKDEEVLVDFSKVSAKVKSWFGKKDKATDKATQPEHHHSDHKEHQGTSEHHSEHSVHHTEHAAHDKKDEDISLDWAKLGTFWKKHARWLIPLLCILIAFTTSVYLRTMPLSLPISDDWAQGTVYNYYRNQLQSQIDQQYPNLPGPNKQALMEKEWQKMYAENKVQIENGVAQLSLQYKNQFRDDQGTPYLLGIDPYYYYRQASLVLKNGFPGTTIREGKIIDEYRLAPVGREEEWDFHPWFGAQWHRFLNLFGNYPLMLTFFLVGTLFSALTVIPGFFIGKIITGNNVGGFFTSLMLAVSSFFVSRTTGESSDTDVYGVFFPILITWLFLEALTAQELKKKLWWTGAAGLATGLFAFAWTGWWYVSGFIMATLLFYIAWLLITQWKDVKASWKEKVLPPLYILGVYVVTSGIFVTLLRTFTEFKRIIGGPLGFKTLKSVGVYSFWPNIKTTVAELNVPGFAQVVDQLGGQLILVLSAVGILLILSRKDEHGKWEVRIPFFLALWLIASLWATTKGVRFILQATPVQAIAFGAFLGIVWHYGSEWTAKGLKIPKKVTMVIMFALLFFLMVEPIQSGYSTAFHSASNMNDAWYNALSKIKNDAPPNAIITSWWDFGHWFKAIADRPVTFDGGTQVGWGAYWVGHSLLTPDEKTTVGIVRMLNCGQNNAFNELDKILNDTPKEVKLLHEIIVQDKEQAIRTLKANGLTIEQITLVIKNTHCEAPEDYYITSEDMIGKSGVWGHFGSWDFDKAVMYQKTHALPRGEAVIYLQENFNLSEPQAEQIHGEIQTTEADRWIAPWPGIFTSRSRCERLSDKEILCQGNFQGGTFAFRVDTTSWNVTFEGNNEIAPNSLVYADREGIHEKRFTGKQVGVSFVLLPSGDGWEFIITDPAQANSVFVKLFYLEGHGLKCFQKFDDANQFSGGRIITWKVDYDCGQENKVYFLPREQVEAAHILISTENRTDEEALAKITELRDKATPRNFAQLARENSDDAGSGEQGGYLGWFGKGRMVKPFEDAAFALEKGEISEPVKTQFGYHVIMVVDKKKE